MWSLDGTAYHTETPATIPAGTRWVFDDSPFFMILNLAVGGDWPGNPDSTTVFPQTLAVDYVRVYGLPPAAAPAQLAAYASGVGEVTLSWRPPNDTAVAENLTGYQLERATDPDFYACYQPVGDFPDVALSPKLIITRLVTAFGVGAKGVL